MKSLKDRLNELISRVGVKHYIASLKNDRNLLVDLVTYTKHLDRTHDLPERVFQVIYPNKVPATCSYGKLPLFNTIEKGYRDYCGSGTSCQCRVEDQSIKISEYQKSVTLEERTRQRSKGIESLQKHFNTTETNPAKVPEIQAKIFATNQLRYQANYPFASKIVQKGIQDRYEAKTTYRFPFENPEVIKKGHNTSRLRYGDPFSKARAAYKEQTGFDSYFCNPENQKKIDEIREIKTGFKKPLQNPAILKKMQDDMEKLTNVRNVMHRHIAVEHLATLNSKEELEAIVMSEGGLEIAAKIMNVNPSTVLKKLHQCNSTLVKSRSIIEDSIASFLDSIDVKYKRNATGICEGNNQLDFLLLDHNIAIEYDSFKYHTIGNERIDKNYHLNKTLQCEAKGIRLIHIFQDEWFNKNTLVKSTIKNLVGLTEKGIPARDVNIRATTWDETSKFLESYHILGAGAPSSISLGAFFEDTLLAIMCFSASQNPFTWDLSRFAADGKSHAGVASKLLSAFIDKAKPHYITSLSDRRWSQGNLYKELGFVLEHTWEPDYSYVICNTFRIHKTKVRKQVIQRKLKYDIKGKSESVIARELKLKRIYNCGLLRFVLKCNSN